MNAPHPVAPTAANPDPLAPLRRRLDKWELHHLRAHALELSERLERTEESLERAKEESAHAWDSADFWRENAFELQEALMEEGATIGITKSGQMGVLKEAPADPFAVPALNEGEVYVGLIVSADGTKRHHTILLPGEREGIAHPDALAWAASIGGALPDRIEQALMYATLRTEFKKDWYWSSEQLASDSDYAWYQDFTGGSQGYDLKDDHCRARAVRRVAI